MKSNIQYRIVQWPTLFLLWILSTSCSSIDIFKENTEIPIAKNYRTFVIINQEVGIRGFSDAKLDELVQQEIRTKLELVGLIYDSKKPDLVIRYRSNEDLRQREIVQNMNPYPLWGYRVYDPWFFNRYYNPMNRRVNTENYELLQVIIDFIDPTKDKFLMTLTGVTEVTSPKYKTKKVSKTLEKVLEKFLYETQNQSK